MSYTINQALINIFRKKKKKKNRKDNFMEKN